MKNVDDMIQFDKIIEGMQILRKYTPDDQFNSVAADHDVIWAGMDCDLEDYDEWDEDDIPRNKYGEIEQCDKRLSEDDHKRLVDLGWCIDTEFDSWEFGV
jgi:hypothetical protein